jgi:hypothetical protein
VITLILTSVFGNAVLGRPEFLLARKYGRWQVVGHRKFWPGRPFPGARILTLSSPRRIAL